MKFPGSARVRAACGYQSKDAGERGVVLRGNEDRDGQPILAHPGRSQYARPPLAVQRVMLGMLGLPAGVCSYRGSYPGCCHPDGRTHDPNVLALAGLASPDPNVLTATRRSLQLCGKSCRPFSRRGVQ